MPSKVLRVLFVPDRIQIDRQTYSGEGTPTVAKVKKRNERKVSKVRDNAVCKSNEWKSHL